MLATILPALAATTAAIEGWMEQAFYPVLVGILVVASLGIPIPEDIPLIAAGVLMHNYPGIASWEGTIFVALIGIMSGDLILYTLGRRWGSDVVNHRLVRRLITPAQFQRASRKFHRWGMWFCFFGRFFMGVRAVMCMTAGATRFPYFRFFVADCAGALLSIPFFVFLGYWFSNMIPTLRLYLTGAQGALLVIGGGVCLVLYLMYRARRRRRKAERAASLGVETEESTGAGDVPLAVAHDAPARPAGETDSENRPAGKTAVARPEPIRARADR